MMAERGVDLAHTALVQTRIMIVIYHRR
jgi:hypothetical protein